VVSIFAALIVAAAASPHAATAHAEDLPRATGKVIVVRGENVAGGGDTDLYLRETGTGEERLLVEDLGKEHSAVWSPDGQRIAFVRETNGQSDIYVVDAMGVSAPVQVTSDLANDLNPGWSADSASLVFESNRNAGLRQVFRVDLDDVSLVSSLTSGTQFENFAPTLSPDGQTVAVARRLVGDANAQIAAISVGTGAVTALTNTTGDHADPEYSPDGGAVAFATNRVSQTADYDLWVMNADGSAETAVTSSPTSETSPRWVIHDGYGTDRLSYVAATSATDWDTRLVDVTGVNDAALVATAANEHFADLQRVVGCTIVWSRGGGTNDWDTAANWDLGRVPGTGDSVCIPDMLTNRTVLHATGAPSLDALTTVENLTVSGGTLSTLDFRGTSGATVTLTGGELYADAFSLDGSGSGLVLSGAGLGTLTTVSAEAGTSVTMTNGTLQTDSVDAASNAQIALTGGTLTGLNGSPELASGTFNWTNTAMGVFRWTVGADATLNLVSLNGTYTLPAGRGITNNGTVDLRKASTVGGNGTFLNTGTVLKNTSDATTHRTNIDAPFDNDGTLSVTNGVVGVRGNDGIDPAANNDTGSFSTGDNGVIEFANNRTNLGASAAWSGSGNFRVASGTLHVGNQGVTLPDDSTLYLEGGTLSGSGALSGGTFSWKQTTALAGPGLFTVGADATLALSTTNGAYTLPLNGGLTNNGTLQLGSAASISGAGTLRNSASASMTKDGTTAQHATDIDTAFDNDGSLIVTTGVVRVRNNDGSDPANSDGGTFWTGDQGTVDFSAGRTNLARADALTGTGAFRVGGAQLDVGSHGLTLPSGGRLALDAGSLTGSGTLAGGTFGWAATFGLPGAFTIDDDATLELPTVNGVYALPTGASLANDGTVDLQRATRIEGDGSLTNRGTLYKRSALQPAHESQIDVAFDNTGTIDVAAGGILVPAAMTADGDPALQNNTLGQGTFVIGDDGTVRFDGPADVQTNNATIEISGSGALLESSGSSALRNLATNTGDLTVRDSATLTTTATLSNSGSVRIGSDSTVTAASYTQSGAGALTRLVDTSPLDPASATLAADTVTFVGGRVEGNGVLDGTVTNAGAAVAPGTSPGTMSVTGDFTQTAGTLELQIHGRTPATFDVLDVGGAALLHGALDIDTQSFEPDWDDDFAVVTSGSGATTDLTAADGLALPSGLTLEPLAVGTGLHLVAVDGMTPTNATVTSTSHALSTWSKDRTVDITLADATDEHSGLAGYAVAWSTDATTTRPPAITTSQSTVTSPALASGRHYVHVRTRDGEGNWTAAEHHGPFFIDGTAPTGGALTSPSTPVSLRTSRNKTPQIQAIWTRAVDPHSGPAGSRVTYRWTTNGKRWSTRTMQLGRRATAVTVKAAAGATYCFRVTRLDAVGNAATSARKCTAVPLDNGALTATKQWSTASNAAYYRGTAARTSTRGATLTRRNVSAKRLSIVATTCPTCGGVQAYWKGKKLGRPVSLKSKKTLHRQVVPIAVVPSTKNATLVLKVTTTGKPVLIDGLLPAV
jgi:hypothetical protein